jgi:hypothetical protein
MGYFSNGTEGEFYEEHYCRCCANYGPEEGPTCPVWMAHLMFAYEECNSDSNAAAILEMLIPRGEYLAEDGIMTPTNEQCTMFVGIPGQLRFEEEQ